MECRYLSSISKDTDAIPFGSPEPFAGAIKKAAGEAAGLELSGRPGVADYFAGVVGLAAAPPAPLRGAAGLAAGAATPDCTL
jgi:hypothetical protein